MAKKNVPRKPAPKRTANKKKAKSKKSKPSILRRSIKLFLLVGIVGLLAAFMLFGAVYIGLFGALPAQEDLKGIKQDNASEVFSKDGKLLGKYFVQNRSQIAFGDIPSIVIDALVATEDNRFFYHEGIDFYSIPRVVIKTLILGDRKGGGGSTISQQLVKNIYGRENFGSLSMPVNKLKENIIALEIEELYSKEEIITLYLNTVSFGENVYGIKAASQRYFKKLPQNLKVEEAATLIGMLKANTAYNPRLYPEKSKERRNTVMALMVQEGFLEPDRFQSLKEQDIVLKYQNVVGNKGIAPYLRAQIAPDIKRILGDLKKPDGSNYNLYTDGLRIELTLDGKLQALAEKSVKGHMQKLQKQFDEHWKGKNPWTNYPNFLWNEAKKSARYKALSQAGKSEAEIKKNFQTKTQLSRFTYEGMELVEMSPIDSVAYHQMILQAGFFAMNPHSGEVVAYVGGIDHGMFPYDHIYAKRQVGSVFKPFVYTAALEAGKMPCDFIENEPIIFSNYDDWSPQNADGKYGGYYSVKGGLAKSVNTIAARLMAETGPEVVIDVAERFGIESDIPEVPAIALGVANLTLREMVTAYSPFANGGNRVKPQFIYRVVTSEGKEIYKAENHKSTSAVNRDYAFEMREMLELVVDSGTARSLRSRFNLHTPMGGKTGTTQNNADGWFVGLTPNLVFGAWVGAESSTVRFRSTRLGQGAATALPIVGNWIHDIEKLPNSKTILGSGFQSLSDDLAENLDCVIYTEAPPKGQFFEGLFDFKKDDDGKQRIDKAEDIKKKNENKKDGWMKRFLKKMKKK